MIWEAVYCFAFASKFWQDTRYLEFVLHCFKIVPTNIVPTSIVPSHSSHCRYDKTCLCVKSLIDA